MRRLIATMVLVLGAASVALEAGAAPAFVLRDPGYSGPIAIKYRNFESFFDTAGAPVPAIASGLQNAGIFIITTIEKDDGFGTPLWVSGDNGLFLTGVFNGFTVGTLSGAGPVNAPASGGVYEVWGNSSIADAAQGIAGYANAGCANATLCYNGITNLVDSQLLLSTSMTPGAIITGNPTSSLNTDFSATTVPLTGKASGYMDVTGGALAGLFDTDGQSGANGKTGLDFFLTNNFCSTGVAGCSQVGDWLLASDDPIRGRLRVPAPASLTIDIKPGSFPNSINLKSKGAVPVAILSSSSFNVVDVDVNTVMFAGAVPEKFAYEDVNSDGMADLVLHFRTQDLHLTDSSTEATLTGKLRDGTSVTGTDSVRIVPGSGNAGKK